MTTVIVARDYGTAATFAARLGLGLDWVYPHDAERLRGLSIEHVVYVEEWQYSPSISLAALAIIYQSGATVDRFIRHAPIPPTPPLVDITTPTQPEEQGRERRTFRSRLSAWIRRHIIAD